MYLTNNNQIGIPMHRRTNTTIEEVNKSIEELSLQWNVSEKDNLKGVSSNIMMGQKIHAGTNNCEILLDEKRLVELLNDDNDIPIYEPDTNNVDTLFEQIIEEGDVYDSDCDDGDFESSFE